MGVVEKLVTSPWQLATSALSPEKGWYLWQLFAAYGLLSLLAPMVVLVAAGPLMSNLLSTFGYQYQIE